MAELVTGYLDDTLSLSEQAHFEYHLRKCPSCTAYLDQIRVTIRRTRQLRRQEPIPPRVLADFLEIYESWLASRS